MMRATLMRLKMHKSTKYKGQRHQSLFPTIYIYRQAKKPTRPGHTVLKSFWTLGVDPTGLQVPNRLDEFRSTYVAQHMPLEYEEWLMACTPHPLAQTLQHSGELADALQRILVPASTHWKRDPMISNMDSVTKPLNELLCSFGDDGAVSARVVRQLLHHHKDELTAVTSAYNTTVHLIGSTPHRRWGFGVGELEGGQSPQGLLEPYHLQLPGKNEGAEQHQLPRGASDAVPSLSPTQQSSVAPKTMTPDEVAELGLYADVLENVTYEDEVLLLHLHNTCARAAVETKEYDEAIRLLQRSLPFARDDQRLAKVHSDIATCEILTGQFANAAVHAQRSVMLCDDPRGYALWSLSRGYEDATTDALSIAARAQELHPNDPNVKSALASLQRHAAGRVDTSSHNRKSRWHVHHTVDRGEERMPFAADFKKRMFDAGASHQYMWFRGPLGPFYKYDPRGW